MVQNMKTASKNIFGFGLVIVLMCIMGGIIFHNMSNISKQSMHMTEKYIPGMNISDKLERNIQNMMYYLREFILTRESQSYVKGKEYFEQMRKDLVRVENTVTDFSETDALKKSVTNAKTLVKTLNESIKKIDKLRMALQNTQRSMDESASTLLKHIEKFLSLQNEYLIGSLYAVMPPERQESFQKIGTVMYRIREICQNTRVLIFKAMARRDRALFQAAIENLSKIDLNFSELLDMNELEGAIELIKTVMEASEKYGKSMKNLQQDLALMEEQSQQIEKNVRELHQFATTISDTGIKETARLAGETRHSISRMNIVMLIGFLIMIVIAVFIAFWITRSIVRPLGAEPFELSEIAKKIALGDIDIRFREDKHLTGVYANMKEMADNIEKKALIAEKVSSGNLLTEIDMASEKDLLGQALIKMIVKLKEILGNIRIVSSQVAAGAGEIADASQSLSQGAAEQAASLEEITSSMIEIGSQTKSNAENASQASSLAGKTKEITEAGKVEMENMISAMAEINESSKEIAKIIKVIDEIAFQTNLLALNAAVEAARAGRYGKGFAVVAEEVRNLAGRSAKAAKETADLIEGAVSKAQHGNEIAKQTFGTFNSIQDAVREVAGFTSEIAIASNEQASGISEINEGLGQVDQVTQQNTANAEETAAAAEELSSQAMQLSEILKIYKFSEDQNEEEELIHQTMKKSAWMDKQQRKNKGMPNMKPEFDGYDQNLNPDEITSLNDDEFGEY